MSHSREYPKRSYIMRLDDKPSGFFQAFHDFIDLKNLNWDQRRLRLELGAPDITECDSDIGWFHRMSEVVDDNVCAQVVDVRWDGRPDTVVYFDVVVAGPKADEVEENPNDYVIFPRMLGEHTHSNTVVRITGFDLVKASGADRGFTTQPVPNEHIKTFATALTEKGTFSEAILDLIRMRPFVLFTAPTPPPAVGPFPSTVRTVPEPWDKRVPDKKVVLAFHIPLVYEGTAAPRDAVKLAEQLDEPGRFTQWDISIPIAKLYNRLNEMVIHSRGFDTADQFKQQQMLADVGLSHQIADVIIRSWTLTDAYLEEVRINCDGEFFRIVMHLNGTATPIV